MAVNAPSLTSNTHRTDMANPANRESEFRIENLPNELLFGIIALICDSQSTYRTLLLVSRRLNSIVKFESLQHIPVRLNMTTVSSFSQFLDSDPDLAGCVRYLWLNGSSAVCKAIAGACTNLVSLACSKDVFHSLCSLHVHRHTSLLELTLFDNVGYWTYLNRLHEELGGIKLCRQITHLRVHEPLSADFKHELFWSLTHYSCSGNMITSFFLLNELAAVGNLPKLDHIVITTFFWADEPADERTKLLYRIDPRVRFLHFGSGQPGEFTLWCGRAKRADCLWTKKNNIQRLL